MGVVAAWRIGIAFEGVCGMFSAVTAMMMKGGGAQRRLFDSYRGIVVAKRELERKCSVASPTEWWLYEVVDMGKELRCQSEKRGRGWEACSRGCREAKRGFMLCIVLYTCRTKTEESRQVVVVNIDGSSE